MDIQEQELKALVERAQGGDMEAFRDIFELLGDRLFRYVLSHIHDRNDALDIVQETFIELWKALSKFRYGGKEKFLGFVFVILKRQLMRFYNSQKSDVPLNEENIRDSYEMRFEDYRMLMGGIGKLSSQYQDLLRLRYWADLPFVEIAWILNTNENTAKVWHHRAIYKLKELLKDQQNDI